MNAELQDDRARGWFHLDNGVIDAFLPEIGVAAFAVYACIARHADRNRVAFPSYTLLQKELRTGRKQVAAAIRVLLDVGLITRETGARAANVYHLETVPTSFPEKLVSERNQCPRETRTSFPEKPELVSQRNSNNTQGTRPKEQDPRERGIRAPARARLVAIPQPWEWADDAEEWAREHKLSWAWVEAHTEVFCDHYLEIEDTAQKRKSIEGWQAAWRKWLLKDLNDERSRAARR